METRTELNDRAGDESADCRNYEASPQRQLSEALNKASLVAASEDFVNDACAHAIRDRAKRTPKADDAGPDQRDLQFTRPRPFLKPNPELKAPQGLEIQASCLPGVVRNIH